MNKSEAMKQYEEEMEAMEILYNRKKDNSVSLIVVIWTLVAIAGFLL